MKPIKSERENLNINEEQLLLPILFEEECGIAIARGSELENGNESYLHPQTHTHMRICT